MSYQETNVQKIKKLIQNPKDNISKVAPFIKSKIAPHKRDVYEFIGSEKLSKPYSGHAILLKYITKKNGFFVQCGGNDGYGFDPTYYLEKFRGWKGIIVEPLPISKLCQRNRKNSIVVQSACVPFGYSGNTVTLIDCNFMSFIKNSIENSEEWISAGEQSQNIKSQEVTVTAQTLQSILNEHHKNFGNATIDLLVADVEGAELQVLQGLDFSKNSPTYILLEIQNSDRFQKIYEFLKTYMYSFVDEIGEKDFLFVKV